MMTEWIPTRARVAVLVAGLALLWLPAPASAWYEKLHQWAGAKKGASANANVKVRKCSGGKLGTYRLEGLIYVKFGKDEVVHGVEADFSVREKWRPLRDLKIDFETPASFDPAITAEILEAYGRYYESIETRWSPGEIEIRHGELRVFGAQILTPGVHKEDFKPKPTCPSFRTAPRGPP